MVNDTTLLLGLDEVRVIGVVELPDRERLVRVATDSSAAAACPECGVFSCSVKERVVTRPKDFPYGEGKVLIEWSKCRWRCREPLCRRGSFTESIMEVPPRMRTTGRLRQKMGHAIGDANRCVDEVAADHGVSWPTAHRAFSELAETVLGEPEPTTKLGIDETRRGKPRWLAPEGPGTGWRRVDPWDTGFFDLAGTQGLLGQAEGRTSQTVIDWLQARSPQFRAGIEFVAIDPAASYAKAVRAALPDATLVVDHFHLVQLANKAVTDTRRRVLWETKGRRGRKTDPAWANRRTLLRGRERLSSKRFTRMWNDLIEADPTQQILTAWIAKEELRTLLRLAKHHSVTHEQIAEAKETFVNWCAQADLPEINTLARTIRDWWPAIEAFLHTGITNAGTEGNNRPIKDVKRVACGFRNPTNQRRRVRYRCTRKHRTATSTSNKMPA